MNSQEVVEQEPITQVPRRSGWIRQEPERYGFIITDKQDIMIINHDEPTFYQEAMESPNPDNWLEAMKFEMDFMYENQVWHLTNLPDGIKPTTCRWVSKIKQSSIEMYLFIRQD